MPQKHQKKVSKFKSVLPEMSARSGLVRNKSSWAHLGPSGHIFCVGWTNPKIKILKIKIRSAQNVGKVWISRKKSSWPHLGPSGPIFCVGRENAKDAQISLIFLGGPMGPIQPLWGGGNGPCGAISGKFFHGPETCKKQ